MLLMNHILTFGLKASFASQSFKPQMTISLTCAHYKFELHSTVFQRLFWAPPMEASYGKPHAPRLSMLDVSLTHPQPSVRIWSSPALWTLLRAIRTMALWITTPFWPSIWNPVMAWWERLGGNRSAWNTKVCFLKYGTITNIECQMLNNLGQCLIFGPMGHCWG